MIVAACRAANISHPPGWTEPNHLSGPLPYLDLSQFGGSTFLVWPMGAYTHHQNWLPGIGAIHSLSLPSQIYPLYENAFRAHCGLSLEQNHTESAKLYSGFAKIAEQNPFSWSHGQPAASEERISTVSNRNRMICFPCIASRHPVFSYVHFCW